MNTFLLVWSWGEETAGRHGNHDISKITIMFRGKESSGKTLKQNFKKLIIW